MRRKRQWCVGKHFTFDDGAARLVSSSLQPFTGRHQAPDVGCAVR